MKANYQVGDVITYRTWTNETRTCKVIEKCKDFKNHKPGFSATLEVTEGIGMGVGTLVWGYDSQIENVPNP